MEDALVCVICLEEGGGGEGGGARPQFGCACKVYLHKDCLESWMKTKSACPICLKTRRRRRRQSLSSTSGGGDRRFYAFWRGARAFAFILFNVYCTYEFLVVLLTTLRAAADTATELLL